MKRLLVMRHAKSDWNASSGSDHSRPLNARGVASARRMGALLTSIGEVPDLVVSSTAMRAATTAELAAETGGWTAPIRYTDAFYDAYPDTVVGFLASVPSDVGSLLIVGHQPTWSGVVNRLTGGSVAMRTATVAVIDLMLGASWEHDGHPSGELIALLQPRHFSHEDTGDVT